MADEKESGRKEKLTCPLPSPPSPSPNSSLDVVTAAITKVHRQIFRAEQIAALLKEWEGPKEEEEEWEGRTEREEGRE